MTDSPAAAGSNIDDELSVGRNIYGPNVAREPQKAAASAASNGSGIPEVLSAIRRGCREPIRFTHGCEVPLLVRHDKQHSRRRRDRKGLALRQATVSGAP